MIDQEIKVPNSITTDENRPVAMDFDLLREQATEIIRKLSPDMWTDHNLHDPGITIMEELCYAITDLAYRLDYPMKDLLAHEDPKRDPYANLSPAYAIMPCMPVTLADMRKVILDVPGVQNAWITRDQNPTPRLYYHDKQKLLTFSARDAVPVPVSGLYNIKIQPEPDYVGGKGPVLKRAVQERWHQCRSLGEDLTSIELIGLQNVAITARIEIKPVQHPNALMQTIFERFTDHISPSPRFHDMETMLSRGYRRDELFSGPLLDHGFIDDDELRNSVPREELRTSDLIKVLMDIPEVRLVKRLEMKVLGEMHPWFVEIEDGKLPQLDILASDIQLLINGQPVGIADRVAANEYFTESRKSMKLPRLPLNQRFPKPPQGEYRNLKDYTSIQNHVPTIYGIGAEGLASSELPSRKAASKQLKAYLLLFEQILANQHAQLEHFKELFAYDQLPTNSQFAQLLKTVPHIDQVFNPWLPLEGIQAEQTGLVYVTLTDDRFAAQQVVELSGTEKSNGIYTIQNVSGSNLVLQKVSDGNSDASPSGQPQIRYHEDQLLDIIRHMADPIDTSGERIHRFYDHLLARYGEIIHDYSSYFATSDTEYRLLNQFLIGQKQQFLKYYQAFSQNRNKGFNYLKKTGNQQNIAGLQTRIQLMLGIGKDRTKDLFTTWYQVLEKIKQYYDLPPVPGLGEEEQVIELLGAMTQFSSFGMIEDHKVRIHSAGKKLLAISKELAAVNPSEAEKQQVLMDHWRQVWEWNFELEGMHLVEHILLRPIPADQASMEHFFHNYYLVETYEINIGKVDENGDQINTLYCTTQREKPQQVGDVIYLSGVSDRQDIRSTVLSIDENGFETRIDSTINSIDHQKGFWYYGEAEREKAAIFMVLHHKITAFSLEEVGGQRFLRCTAANHGLQTGTWIDLQVGAQNSTLEQGLAVEEDTFLISWVADETEIAWETMVGTWQYANAKHDPYSLQLTMIFPKWPGRMQNPAFRALVEQTVRNETPAHHNVYVRWLDLDEMRSFEIHQSVWLKYLYENGL